MKNKSWKNIVLVTAIAVPIVKILYSFINIEPEKYSREWFDKLSDEDLDREREIVFNSKDNPDKYNLLDTFNRVMYSRDQKRHAGEKHNPIPPREHGNNLYKPDD